MKRRVGAAFWAFLVLPSSARGADPAPVIPAPAASRAPLEAHPRPGPRPADGPRTPEVERAEAALREAEQRVRESQLEVARRQGDVQLARFRLDLARTEADAAAGQAAGTREGRTRAKALGSRVKALKTIVGEDIPEIRALESRLLAAQKAEDTGGMAAIQQALNMRRRLMAIHQTEGDLALARLDKDPRRARALERRLEEMAKQQPIGSADRPPARGATR